jgi:hypothetical protein
VRPHRAIVIDASIARAAGESEHPVSSMCRTFLVEVLRICHHVAASDAILEEWNGHMSRFTRTWLASMYARKKVDWLEVQVDNELRAAISGAARTDAERKGMLKDIHLIELALHVEAPVTSLDENTARGPFEGACRTVSRLRRIVWVNPTRENEQALEWLRGGAKPEPCPVPGVWY